MFTFLAGAKAYAYLGIGLVILALAGVVYVQRLEHKADVASIALAKQNLDTVTNALKQSEADKALLAQKARDLDSAIKERDARLKALDETKRKLADELDRLKKTVPAEDKACLDRPLPNGILDLLRDGPAGGNTQRPDPGSGKPAPAVPQV